MAGLTVHHTHQRWQQTRTPSLVSDMSHSAPSRNETIRPYTVLCKGRWMHFACSRWKETAVRCTQKGVETVTPSSTSRSLPLSMSTQPNIYFVGGSVQHIPKSAMRFFLVIEPLSTETSHHWTTVMRNRAGYCFFFALLSGRIWKPSSIITTSFGSGSEIVGER